MPNPSSKIVCVFCGSVLRLAQSEHVKNANGKMVFRQYWRCRTADCGQPYIEGKSKADCVQMARKKYSKKAREDRQAQKPKPKLIIHDEVSSKDPADEDFEAIKAVVNRTKEGVTNE